MVKKPKSLKKSLEIKKSLKEFVADEDGYVSKETILKIGLATVAGIGMLGSLSTMASHTSHSAHASHPNMPTLATTCPTSEILHNSTPGHASHTSY